MGKIHLAECNCFNKIKAKYILVNGMEIMCHTERFGPQGCKTSPVRRHCYICGHIVARRNVAILSVVSGGSYGADR